MPHAASKLRDKLLPVHTWACRVNVAFSPADPRAEHLIAQRWNEGYFPMQKVDKAMIFNIHSQLRNSVDSGDIQET
jgi:hypothetical protein